MLVYDEFRAMNTTIQVAAEGRRTDLAAGFEQVRRSVAEQEERFSRFRAESELSRLNRSTGRWFSCSEPMYALLEESAAAYRLTDGLCDPAILPALECAGYDRSFETIKEAPRYHGRTPVAEDGPGFDQVELDPAACAVWLPPGLRIDMGGIAKGWIAERAAGLLAGFTGAGAVSAGGDMSLFGLPVGETMWQISLEDPRDRERVIAVVSAAPGAVATSSIGKRRWQLDGLDRHHIIDPRTGAPAEAEFLSVTVWTEKATEAEALAKAILIAGPDTGWAFRERSADVRYLAVRFDGDLCGDLDWVPAARPEGDEK